jgi:hypothetical protein
MIWRTTSRIGAICAVAAIVAISGTALAYFTTGGAGSAAAAVTQLGTPTISSATAATGGMVTVTWKAVTAPGAGTVTYYVTRNGEEADGNCPTAKEPSTVLTCTDSGLDPAVYHYTVTALFHTWSKTSAVTNSQVVVGPVAKFAIAGSPTSAAAGAAVNLTITAQDAAGKPVTTFTGTHNLVFSGAANSPNGTGPTVAGNAATAGIAFGTATPLTFTTGSTTVASSKNGVLKLYKPGENTVSATEGSLTTPEPLTVNVVPGPASKFVLTAANATTAAGVGDNLTITTFDAYGSAATNYSGSHNLVFSGASASPNNTQPTVDDSSGNHVPFGTATPIVFNGGVATVSEGGNGELTLVKVGAATIKASESTTVTTTTGVTVTATPATAASLTLSPAANSLSDTGTDNFTTTAKDAYGNTATGYSGPKNLTFSGAETSPGGNPPTVTNESGTAIPFGTATQINFAAGIATVTSPKNGQLRIYKVGTPSVSATDGTIVSAPVPLTVTISSAKKVAFSGLTASAGTIGSPCFFTCAITLLGSSGTVSANLMITDEYGNTVSAIGASKTVTVTSSGTAGSTVTGSPLALPATGPAVTSTRFTYTAPTSGAYGNTITAASTGYASATATTSK